MIGEILILTRIVVEHPALMTNIVLPAVPGSGEWRLTGPAPAGIMADK